MGFGVIQTFASLYSGIGAADFGLEQAGWRGVWRAERDPWRASLLDRHWPSVPVYPLVEEVPADAEPVDLLVADPPAGDPRWFDAVWPLVERLEPAVLFFAVGRRCSAAFDVEFARLGYGGVGFVVTVDTEARDGLRWQAKRPVIVAWRGGLAPVRDALVRGVTAKVREQDALPVELAEVAEKFMGLPLGWTCTCRRERGTCQESAARLLAVNDAVAPALAYAVGAVLAVTAVPELVAAGRG